MSPAPGAPQRPFAKTLTRLLSVILLGCLTASPNSGGNVVIIANPGVKTNEISIDELRAVFLGTATSFGEDSHLKPVLEKGGPAHSAFLKQYLGKTDFALQTYYRSLVFSGLGSMPPILRSDADVIAYVQKTRGAIGYVAPSFVDSGVKTLRVR